MIEVSVFDAKPYDREFLSSAACANEINFRFHEFRLSRETVAAAKGAKAVCVFVNDRADRECLEALAAMDIKLVTLRCAGFNNVDVAAAGEFGITVVRVPAYSPHAVAEHTVGLLLTLNRKIHRAYNRVRELNFSLSGLVGFDIQGKTIGIIGTGKIGQITAQIFRGFDANVLAYDSFPAMQWADSYQVRYTDMNSLLAQSDVVSLHLPLSSETLYLLNAQTISQMKRGAYIINTSRGKLVDTTALIAALKTGHIGGVALDVYEEEEGIFFQDLSGQVLLDDELTHLLMFPNVLVTSHQAFLTHEALHEIARVTTENICRLEKGEPFLSGTML